MCYRSGSENKFCRLSVCSERVIFTAREKIVPRERESGFCRERVSFAGKQLVLPFESKFYGERGSFTARE